MTLYVVVEGDTDLPVARRLAEDAGLEIALELPQRGKAELDAALPAYADAAKGSPWFVLRDLDHDADCAPSFLTKQAIPRRPWLCFRLAVRSVEAWLLADESIATFLGVPKHRLPLEPDTLDFPKRHLVEIARRGKPRIRSGMVPVPGGKRPTGPLYESLVIEFGSMGWDLDRAVRRSESLRSARASLRALGARWKAFGEGPRKRR